MCKSLWVNPLECIHSTASNYKQKSFCQQRNQFEIFNKTHHLQNNLHRRNVWKWTEFKPQIFQCSSYSFHNNNGFGFICFREKMIERRESIYLSAPDSFQKNFNEIEFNTLNIFHFITYDDGPSFCIYSSPSVYFQFESLVP